jgi:endoglucanase
MYRNNSVRLGVYDSTNAFSASTDLAIESLYVLDWNKPLTNIGNGSSLVDALNLAASRSRIPMVTIQPVSNPKLTKNPANTLAHIALGKYDSCTKSIADAMNEYGGAAMLRWGPEMDDPNNIGKLDWAVTPDNASDYVRAYQRRTTVYRSYTNNLSDQTFVWSPVGSAYSNVFFPGYSFVDYVGVSVFGWSVYQGPFGSSFANQLGLIYDFVSGYGKPVIAEIGAEIADDQAAWATAAKAAFASFPLLDAAIWYSGRDSFPWVESGPIPNWVTTPDVWNGS